MKHGPEPSFRERMGKFARRHPALCGTTSIAFISIIMIALLGTAVVKIFRLLQVFQARVAVRHFDRTFTAIQFLLSAASGADDRLKRGLRSAHQEIERIKADTGSPPGTRAGPRVSRQPNRKGFASNWSR